MTEQDQQSRPLLQRLTTAILLAVTLLSVGTYFTALSQYPTADQDLTALRLNGFIADFSSVEPTKGSLVSNLVVAIPGHLMAKVLDKFYAVNDPIIGSIRYTAILPFAFVQVVVTLGLIFFLAKLVARLALIEDSNPERFLLAFIVILNFPMLKAICKVLKYDALSTLFSAIAIILYMGYRQHNGRPPPALLGRYCVAAIGTFCGLAYLEKDTSISVALLIVALELAIIPLVVADRLNAAATAARFLAILVVTLLVTTILLVPKMLANPRHLPELFGGIPQYFINLPSSAGLAFAGLLLAAYALGPIARRTWLAAERWGSIVRASLATATVVIPVLGVSAWVFQSNILYDPTIPGNDIDPEQLRAQGIYVSQPIAFSAITTLDDSAWMQHIKIYYSMVRAIFYTLPELTVLMIVGAAPLYLFLARASPAGHRDAAVLLLLLFPAGMLTAYSLADIPFEPKYLVIASLLFTIYGLFPVLIGLERVSSPAVHAARIAVAAVMLLTALSAAPSYLRYKNIFRDRELENAAATDMNHYIWWTWAGWGETAYPIAQYLEQHARAPVTVAYDYRAPFYSIALTRWVRADFDKCQTDDELRTRLRRITAQEADYLIISKNVSNRNWCLNRILRRMRESAVFVDVQQGFEYGWLFRFADVVRAFRD